MKLEDMKPCPFCGAVVEELPDTPSDENVCFLKILTPISTVSVSIRNNGN